MDAKKPETTEALRLIATLMVKHQTLLNDRQLSLVHEAMQTVAQSFYMRSEYAKTPEAKAAVREFNTHIYQTAQDMGLGMKTEIPLYE